ncbi:hypothetical protein SEA_GAUGELDP_60 [Mycobacterium phage GaugeLDP]|nr:hypothetical protein SEA_GAUGELDP_60 [Mycobacterium phage GaugeLDP]
MGYVVGLCVLYGLLAWFCLCCDAREERERAAEAESMRRLHD